MDKRIDSVIPLLYSISSIQCQSPKSFTFSLLPSNSLAPANSTSTSASSSANFAQTTFEELESALISTLASIPANDYSSKIPLIDRILYHARYLPCAFASLLQLKSSLNSDRIVHASDTPSRYFILFYLNISFFVLPLIFMRCSSITFTCAVCDLESSSFPEQPLFLIQPNILSELASWFKAKSAKNTNGNLIYNAKFCTSSFKLCLDLIFSYRRLLISELIVASNVLLLDTYLIQYSVVTD